MSNVDTTTMAPMNNTPEARTPSGELIDQTAVTPSEPTGPEGGNQEGGLEGKTPTVPEAYTFTAPEGYTIDQALTDAVTPVFRELGLTQEQASKLFDIQAAHQIDLAKKIDTSVATMRQEWVDAVKADPQMGPRLDQVKTDIGRMWQHLPAEAVTKFKAAMDFTGAGDNPDIVRGLWELSKHVNEGKHVSGGGPSPNGQTPTGTVARPTAAKSLYPNLS